MSNVHIHNAKILKIFIKDRFKRKKYFLQNVYMYVQYCIKFMKALFVINQIKTIHNSAREREKEKDRLSSKKVTKCFTTIPSYYKLYVKRGAHCMKRGRERQREKKERETQKE